jgi:hypothetical protein
LAATDAETLQQEILRLLDPSTGDVQRRTFHASRISPAGQQRWPVDLFERLFREISATSGGFELIDLRDDGREAWLQLQSRRQGAVRTLRVRRDRDDPDRYFDISASPMPTPYTGLRPQGPVAEQELAAWVDRRVRFAVERDEFSGAVQVCSPKGVPLYEAAFGLADREAEKANTLETRFNLG